MNLAFLNIGTQEMFFIIIIALLLFGGKKLPELARGLGRGIREFKDASEGIKKEISDQINNFEKDIDQIKNDIEREPAPAAAKPEVTPQSPSATEQQPEAANNTEEVQAGSETSSEQTEQKVPQFTAPEGTYQHKPYTPPTQDDYYNQGYQDHFAQQQSPVEDAHEGQVEESSNASETPEVGSSAEDAKA